MSHRVSGNLKQHAVERLDQWFETLPFPLASILRAWQATAGEDFKTKHEHLLHFFEAAAEFFSVIFLSAFKSNDALFETHKVKLMEALEQMGLGFRRPSFGTWKLVTEYLVKQTRMLLGGDNEGRALCAELFSDPGLTLPEAVSRKEIATVLSAANKIRNDTAHGGVLGQEEARLLNEQLLGQVQKLREAMGNVWNEIQLIQPLRCVLRRGTFQTDFTVLMSSNSEFLTDTRQMMMCLDAEHLYLSNKRSGRALKLLPLVQFGPAPQSARNACYFFNRLERDGARFISYHFIEKPALTGHFDEATNTIKSLITS